MLKYIFFDNDGILVNTEEIFFRANHEAFLTHFSNTNIIHNKETFHHYNRDSGIQAWLKSRGTDPQTLKKLHTDRNHLYQSLLASTNITIPHVRETLLALKQTYDLAIVTSATQNQLRCIHERTELFPYFRFTVTQDNVSNIKPDPECYLQALERADISPDQAIVIEDSPRGIHAAQAAGIFTIGIPNPFSSHLDISFADAQLDSIQQLPGFLSINYPSFHCPLR